MSDNVYTVKTPTMGSSENGAKDTEGEGKRQLDCFDDPPPVGADFLTDDQRQVRVLTPYLTYLIEDVEYAAAAGMYGKDHVFVIFREHQQESMVFPAGLAEHLLTECILRGGE